MQRYSPALWKDAQATLSKADTMLLRFHRRFRAGQLRMNNKGGLFPRLTVLSAVLICWPMWAICGTVNVLGYGNRSCGSWLQVRNIPSYDEAAQLSWVAGYLTGFNNYASGQSGNVSAGIDLDGQFAWIDAYCQAHPLDSLFQATGALVRELEKRAR